MPNLAEFYQKLETHAANEIRGWKNLAQADPSRILLEAVARYAHDLYDVLRPETESLFANLPDYFGYEESVSKAVHGVVMMELAATTKAAFVLPAGTVMLSGDWLTPRRFVSTQDVQLNPLGQQRLHYTENELWFAVERLPQQLRIYVHQDAASEATSAYQLYIYTQHGKQMLQLQDSSQHGSGFISAAIHMKQASETEKFNHKAYWFCLQKLDRLQQSSSMSKIKVHFNAVPVSEQSYLEELTLGRLLDVEHQLLTLPIQPQQLPLQLYVEGERQPWHVVTMAAEDQRAIIYNPQHNQIDLHPLRQHAGKKIELRQVYHAGDFSLLSAASIQRLATAMPAIAAMHQPYPFYATKAEQSLAARQARFQAKLWSQTVCGSLTDYANLALTFDGISYAKAYCQQRHLRQIELYVHGPAVIDNTDVAATDACHHAYLQTMTEQIAARSLIGQNVKVKVARYRDFTIRLLENDDAVADKQLSLVAGLNRLYIDDEVSVARLNAYLSGWVPNMHAAFHLVNDRGLFIEQSEKLEVGEIARFHIQNGGEV